jgi:hypothetical protein
MLGEALLVRFEVFVSTAVVAAHASAKGEGFRQRDVRFFIELFSNWVERGLPDKALSVQNTQVQRYLDLLVREGYARKISRAKRPVYRLTRTGLLELVSRSLDPKLLWTKEQFFFLHYYIKNYKPLLEALIKAEGKQFPYALRVELDTLFDSKALLKKELKRAKQELAELEVRIKDGLATGELVDALTKQGLDVDEIVKQVEAAYPYELNSQKPLTELIGGIPEGMRLWELRVGNVNRVRQIWQPISFGLRCYINELEKLE